MPNNDAPISPPKNVTVSASSEGVTLAWSTNHESDVAGYKVYYGNFTGYSFTNSVDVGWAPGEVTLSGLSISDTVALTAYDGNADGTNDQTDGNESWFSYAKYVNETPTIAALSDTTILEDSGVQSFLVSGISSGNELDSQTLTLTATASNGPIDSLSVQYSMVLVTAISISY